MAMTTCPKCGSSLFHGPAMITCGNGDCDWNELDHYRKLASTSISLLKTSTEQLVYSNGLLERVVNEIDDEQLYYEIRVHLEGD